MDPLENNDDPTSYTYNDAPEMDTLFDAWPFPEFDASLFDDTTGYDTTYDKLVGNDVQDGAHDKHPVNTPATSTADILKQAMDISGINQHGGADFMDVSDDSVEADQQPDEYIQQDVEQIPSVSDGATEYVDEPQPGPSSSNNNKQQPGRSSSNNDEQQPGPSSSNNDEQQPGPSSANNDELLVDDTKFKPSDYFKLEPASSKASKRFHTVITTRNITFKDMSTIPPAKYAQAVTSIFQEILDIFNQNHYKNHDMVRFYMNSNNLTASVNMPFVRVPELTPESIVAKICKLQNSNQAFNLDNDSFQFSIIHTTMPEPGSGKNLYGSCKRRSIAVMDKWSAKKRCTIIIKNNDMLCCARAIVVAIAYYKYKEVPVENIAEKKKACQEYKSLIYTGHADRQCKQNNAAGYLHAACGKPKTPCGIEEVRQYERHGEYRIVVLSSNTNFEPVYAGDITKTKTIYLLLANGHYDVISKPSSLFNASLYCETCLKSCNKRNHVCPGGCRSCFRRICEGRKTELKPSKQCNVCHRLFYGELCYTAHLESVCIQHRSCPKCSNQVNYGQHHECGKYVCRFCYRLAPIGHLCYIQKPKVTEEPDAVDELDASGKRNKQDACVARKKRTQSPKSKYFYYDFECMQDTGVHTPNLVVCQESNQQWIFDMEDGKCPRDKFCTWVFDEHCGESSDVPLVFIAHYARGYDSHLIMEWLYTNNLYPDVIWTGQKIMWILLKGLKIKFIDSHNFLSMPLAKLPSTFNLKELKKGHFPHFFNTPANQNYVGPIPETHFYGADAKTPKDREEFLQWYEFNKDAEFNMQQNLLDYCISDVTILREACTAFQEMAMNLFQVDPFESSATIASFCHTVYRGRYMPSNSIGVIPIGGYRNKERYSIISMHWLLWLEHTKGITIQHARKLGGEVKFGRYSVDGYDETNNIIYEFLGCFFHGCPKCYNSETVNPKLGGTMDDHLLKTYTRLADIQEAADVKMRDTPGSTEAKIRIETIWECDFKDLINRTPELGAFISKNDIAEPLSPKDAFFGGRTAPTRLHYKAKEGEIIRYMDYVSLYPTVNKYDKMPAGHPTLILAPPSYTIGQYFGIVKCTVLPPQKLYHPVLPYRNNGKLLFPLCRTCAAERSSEQCIHQPEERAICGTWVSVELDKALEKGYTILQINEVWNYTKTLQLDPAKNTDGLFGGYVNTLLKIKQESSGWPGRLKDDADKQAFLDEYEQKEGIKLDPTAMTVNPGKRTLAKLMLNSLWGKFGQRENLSQTKYLKDYHELTELLTSDEHEVNNIHFINDDMIMVDYISTADFTIPSGKTSVVIAAFTAACARLRLYKLLDQLQEDVLYMDTDSVIFISPKDTNPLQKYLGEFLGCVTDEIVDAHGVGTHITEFVSGGPKNYGYRISNNKDCWKVKGISQTYATTQIIDYDVIRSMVTNGQEESLLLTSNMITRNKETAKLVNKLQTKTYRIVFDKALVDAELKTWPFGYCV